MSTRSRRQITPFNLSFLDIMFCGFGAVVMLVLIINTNTITRRSEKHEDLRLDVERLELELTVYRKKERDLEQQIAKKQEEIVRVTRQQEEVRKQAADKKAQQQSLLRLLQQLDKEKERLKKAVKSAAAEREVLAKEIDQEKEAGAKVRRFEGEGNRQYLTGFKLGGRRVLILLDSSASMLDRTVVNIIRRRVMDGPSKKSAPKWQRAVRTVNWIVSHLPPQSRVQIVHFNEKAVRLGDSEWIKATDAAQLNALLTSLAALVPQGGTSLENGFRRVRTFSSLPDNIILITDGLPTQGIAKSRKTTITGEEREKLFQRALKQLPARLPVNTILFPMEGDPMAASLFWRLAADSNGSFFTPTEDWP